MMRKIIPIICFFLWAESLMAAPVSHSRSMGFSEEQFAREQAYFSRYSAYMVRNGRYVEMVLPISKIYRSQTTYFNDQAQYVISDIEKFIAHSSGKIILEGMIPGGSDDPAFNESALYAQVSHLSQFLLRNAHNVTYAPLTVRSYRKNEKYGFWSKFPSEQVFVRLLLEFGSQ